MNAHSAHAAPIRRRLFRRHLIAAGLAAVALAPSLARAQDTSKAQPVLPREKLVIVGHDGKRHDFMVEMALTPAQEEVGLMWRTSVPADSGMLFDWGTSRRSQMWMRNTLVPLDMVFIAADGTVAAIAEDTVPRSLAIIDSRKPVRATLELQGGITRKLDIRVGDKVEGKLFGNSGQG